MDSERRHELETNDLREFLDNFKDFWDKHGNRLLITLIVVLAAWVGYVRYNQWQADKAEAAYAELNNADSADALRGVAAERGEVHDEAMRRAGDVALGEARTALIADEKDKAEKALKTALAAYNALVNRGATVEYQLVGHEGLAKVALMQEDWDKAAEHYKQLGELAGDVFVTQADRAKRALERIDLLKNPVAFAEPEQPIVEPEQEGTEAGEPKPELPPLPAPPAE